MSSQDTLRILLLGHSFVWRLAQFAAEATIPCISSDFHLMGPSSVQFYGIGGRTLTKLRQFDLSLVAQFKPTILLLEIGSNDLINPRLEATDLATNIFRLAQQLHFSYRVSHIIVSQILPGRSPPQIFPPYNTKVNQLNRSLHHLFKATLFATFWLHPRILHSCRRILLRDGIHLNFAGNHILYHSYQKAIMYCLSRHNSIIPNPRPVFVLRPKSLMISHTAQPLVFFSETKLMHLTTRLKAIPAGPSLQISNNCSSTQQEFFDSLLNSIHGTQKVATRLLSLSSFSNLLECDSYLR